MEFRVEPTPLGRRRSRRILAATGLIVIALAVVIGALARGNAPPSATVAVASVAPAGVTAATPTASPSPSTTAVAIARTGPAPRVVCHDIADGRCGAVARAALDAATDPALPWPSRIDVWASLLCGSVFDCPPDRLTGRQAAGSAVVVAGTIGLWVNVVGPSAGSGSGSLDAWVIRSGPVG